MANLSKLDRIKLENFLNMHNGYVLDFQTRKAFEDFMLETIGVDICEGKYSTGSNAKRMRAFWDIESDLVVANLIDVLVECEKKYHLLDMDSDRITEMQACIEISKRLSGYNTVESIEPLTNDQPSDELSLLAKEIVSSVEKNQPQVAIDRLHTYLMKYFRVLCEKYNIKIEKKLRNTH